jgi:hypothetical protein
MASTGAGDAARTRDIFLGKEVLYQLSYTRFWSIREVESCARSGGNQVIFELRTCVARDRAEWHARPALSVPSD